MAVIEVPKSKLLTTIRAAALARNQHWMAAAWLFERKYLRGI